MRLFVIFWTAGILLPGTSSQTKFYYLKADSSLQYLRSPNYPSKYPSNQDIVWTIDTNMTGKVIKLDFISFSLEYSSSCAYDYVRVYDGTYTNKKLSKEVCGSSPPPSVKSSGMSAVVLFHSDGSEENRGFEISYTVADPDPVTESNTSLIVGAVLGSVAGAALIAGIGGCIYCACKKPSKVTRVAPNAPSRPIGVTVTTTSTTSPYPSYSGYGPPCQSYVPYGEPQPSYVPYSVPQMSAMPPPPQYQPAAPPSYPPPPYSSVVPHPPQLPPVLQTPGAQVHSSSLRPIDPGFNVPPSAPTYNSTSGL